jgi:hypothetical protein
MPNLNTAPFSAKINRGNPKANHKQKVLKFTDADLYSEESETALLVSRVKVKPPKNKEEHHRIF